MIQAMILSSFLLACAAFLLAVARLRRDRQRGGRGHEGHGGVPATGPTPAPSPPPPAAEPPTPFARVQPAAPAPATETARHAAPELVAGPASPAPGPARFAARSARNNGFSRFASQPGARAAQHR